MARRRRERMSEGKKNIIAGLNSRIQHQDSRRYSRGTKGSVRRYYSGNDGS